MHELAVRDRALFRSDVLELWLHELLPSRGPLFDLVLGDVVGPSGRDGFPAELIFCADEWSERVEQSSKCVDAEGH